MLAHTQSTIWPYIAEFIYERNKHNIRLTIDFFAYFVSVFWSAGIGGAKIIGIILLG